MAPMVAGMDLYLRTLIVRRPTLIWFSERNYMCLMGLFSLFSPECFGPFDVSFFFLMSTFLYSVPLGKELGSSSSDIACVFVSTEFSYRIQMGLIQNEPPFECWKIGIMAKP